MAYLLTIAVAHNIGIQILWLLANDYKDRACKEAILL
jgi:hypothetical protein